ncbi:MAG: cytochrome c maturation protein CcmE [Chloroflexi bacterium]|nr:cytochrome c maturation protein CcmE [Chloroflexota bacterium]
MLPKKRKFLIAGTVLLLGFGFLGFQAFMSASQYYLTVSELKAMGEKAYLEKSIKLGGTVQPGTISYENNSRLLRFTLTDGAESVPVAYAGIVPDSFKPDTEVVVEGKYSEAGVFQAVGLLAKCPSKYTPAT